MIIYISNQNNHGIGHTKKPLHARTWPQMTWVDLDSSLMYISLFISVLIQVGTKNKSFKKEKYVRRKSRNFYWYNN